MSAPGTAEPVTKELVRTFWERVPCGGKHARAREGTAQYFEEVERAREELEPFIARYAQFTETGGLRVLEIGTGLGTDLVRFARAGAHVTGVDLTEKSIALVRRRFALEGRTADLQVADAERLPFDDESFDVVYSWGVLHHTPDPPKAFAEALRVLRPGGRLCLMVYARYSWVAFGLWARYALLRGRPTRRLSEVIAHHMESAGTRAFTTSEAKLLVSPLDDLSIEHVGTPYDRRVAGPLVGVTGGRLGWFLVVRGRRPLSLA